jgi:hypothetical protein
LEEYIYETLAIDSKTKIIKTDDEKELTAVIDFVTKRNKDSNLKSFLFYASPKRKIVENFKFNRDECYAE